MAEPITDPDLLAKLNSAPPQEVDDASGTAMDVAKSGGMGLAEGFMEGAGGLGTMRDMTVSGLESLFGKKGARDILRSGLGAFSGLAGVAPSGAQIKKGVQGVTGEFYQPKTTAGGYAKSAGEFLGDPLSYIGPGGPLTKMGIATAGGLGKHFAEEQVDPEDKPFAGIIGALSASLGTAGLLGLTRALTNTMRPYRTIPGTDIPATRGMLTGDTAQIAEEQAMSAGSRGRWARNVMAGAEGARSNAVEGAIEGTAGDIGGARATPGEVGAAVKSGLEGRATDFEQAGTAAYESAKAKNAWAVAGEHRPTKAVDAALGNESMDLHEGLSGANRAYRIIRGLEPGARSDPMNTRVQGGLQNIFSENAAPSINAAPTLESNMNPHLISLKRMLEVRRQLRPINGVNPEDGEALKVIKHTYDDWMRNTVDNALFHGDKTAIQDVAEGNRQWWQYRRLTDPRHRGDPADAQRVIADIVNNERTGDEVVNFLLNSVSTNMAGRASRIASRVKETLGADSDEWQALRQLAWQRMVSTPTGTRRGQQAIAGEIESFVNGTGNPLARELYSAAELDQMRHFARVLRTLTPPRANPSGSGHEVARWGWPLITGMAGLMGLEGVHHTGHLRWLGIGALPLIRDIKQAMKADVATKQTLQPVGLGRSMVRGTVPAVAGTDFGAEGTP